MVLKITELFIAKNTKKSLAPLGKVEQNIIGSKGQLMNIGNGVKVFSTEMVTHVNVAETKMVMDTE